MLDVASGAVIGLLFSQVLITPNPVRNIDDAARNLFDELAKGLRTCAEALQENDPATAEMGLKRLFAARRSVASLDAEIQAARNAARWSLRGRFAAREIGAAFQRYDRNAIQLYASALLLGQGLANALREVNACVPNGLQERIVDASQRCKSLVGPEGPELRPGPNGYVAVPSNRIPHRSGDGRCHVCERNGNALSFQQCDPMG